MVAPLVPYSSSSLMVLLLEGQTGEAWEPANKAVFAVSDMGDRWTGKVLLYIIFGLRHRFS
jgi:hypothetical protein